MTYSESAEGEMIGRNRVIAELGNHGIVSDAEVAECFRYLGEHKLYDAGRVLEWLGY